MMSMCFNRNVLIPVWIGGVLGLFTLFVAPQSLATGSLVLFTAIAPPAVMLILWRAPSLTLAESIAEVLHPFRSGTQ